MKDCPEPIEVRQLARQASPSEWIRGKAYYRNGRVVNLTAARIAPDGCRSVCAEVRAAELHTGRLTLTLSHGRLLDWHCSCPQDQTRPCRHILAVLLQDLQESDKPLLRHLLAEQAWQPADSGEKTQTEVHILFRYQKQTGRILVMPRLITRDASGQKVMSRNPLDPDDVIINSRVTDRMALLRDRNNGQAVSDFFSQWKSHQPEFIGCLSFDADQDLPVLVQQVLPALPAAWHVLYDREFERIIPNRKPVAVDFSHLRQESAGLLSFDLDFHCDQLSLDREQLQAYLLGQQKWLLINGQFVEATNKKQLVHLLELLNRLQQSASGDGGQYEAGPASLADLVLSGISAASDPDKTAVAFDASFELLRAGLAAEPAVGADVIRNNAVWNHVIPVQLDQILRPYQRHGVQWLLFLGYFHLGGILADDMGLGKTLQVLAALLAKQTAKPAAMFSAKPSAMRTAKLAAKPSLIICPKTLLFNWLNEAKRFVPALKTVLVHGSQEYRRRLLRQAEDFDLMITSYSLVQRDIAQYSRLEFACCILDEAQMIKNPDTHLAHHVKKIKSTQRVALTGTPMENNILDLWSIFDFILPGYLGQKDAFRIQYEQSEQSGQSGLDRLKAKIKPFLLRRTKIDVLPELPEKIEETIYAPLTQNQLALYHQALTQIRRDMQDTLDRQELARSRMAILAGLTRLRQISNHPGLVHDAYRTVHGISGKFELFDEMLQNLLANGHKVLVFSQFTQMLAILSRRLEEQQVAYCYLDGQTDDRQQVIQHFNSDAGPPIFLISLKAGGFGLNLTTADTVILFDPWWNPMVENQAADRVHRIGQKNVVTIYRLISQGTIEEKMIHLQERKRQEFDRIINQSASQGDQPISLADLKALLEEDGA